MKLDQANTTPSIAKLKKAAHHFANTAPERKAFIQLLRREPIVSAKQLATAAAEGVASLHDARRKLSDMTLAQMAKGLRLALALSRSPQKLTAFYQHKFWNYKKPNQSKLLLSCLQFAMPPRNDIERKLLSKHAAAVNWLVLQGYGPDDLGQGVRKEGGQAACATKLAAWRREQKAASADHGDPTARAQTGAAVGKKRVANAVAAGATPATTRLPIRCVKGLRQKIKDRKPPADRNYFWARIHHRGDRISIVRIASNRRPKR